MSAHLNPFRVERIHALSFEPVGATWPELMQRLEQARFRAAIVGPHGTGKTTLLNELGRRLADSGFRVEHVRYNAEHRPTSFAELANLLDAGCHAPGFAGACGPAASEASCPCKAKGMAPAPSRVSACGDPGTPSVRRVILLDGYEQLSPLMRLQLMHRLRRAPATAGLIATSHRGTLLPTLLHTSTTPALLSSLIGQLAGDDAPRWIAGNDQLLRRHRGNVREALFELYDRWAAASR